MLDKITFTGADESVDPMDLAKIGFKVNLDGHDKRFWIDMETRVRSDDGRRFDLDKVKECLRIAEDFKKFNGR